MATQLPRFFICSDSVNMVDYIDINYSTLSLNSPPTITANASVDVNIYISDKTNSTARINFSQKFIGTVYYTVVGTV
jgi:hypothetical protein